MYQIQFIEGGGGERERKSSFSLRSHGCSLTEHLVASGCVGSTDDNGDFAIVRKWEDPKSELLRTSFGPELIFVHAWSTVMERVF